MKKKIIGKVILCLLIASVLLGACVIFFHMMLQRSLDLRTICIASHDISPRSRITEKDIAEAEVSGSWMPDGICIRQEDIIGKYTGIRGKIPAGSPFYESMLEDGSDMPDQPLTLLKPGQTAYTMETDITRLGSITEGMYVDIHYSAGRSSDGPAAGPLIRHALVISVKDHQGKSILSEDSSGVPYLIETAVSREDLDLLAFAESEGELRVFSSAEPYDDNEETKRADSEITAYLLKRMYAEE